MSGYPESTETPHAYSMADTFGRVQVAPHNGLITVDVQGRHYSTTAELYVDHGFARLSVTHAIKLRGMLDQAIERIQDAPNAAQPGLWSDTTISAVASRFGRAALVALAVICAAAPSFAADPCPVGAVCAVKQPGPPPAPEQPSDIATEIMKLRLVQTESMTIQIEILNALQSLIAEKAAK